VLVPSLAEYPEVWGIYVGAGCVTGDSPLDWRTIEAHAHVLDEWTGWICIANRRSVVTANGRATHLLLHEVGHVLVGDTSHGKRWRDMVTGLGAAKEAKRYERGRA
jgi:hypothetical protein